MTYTEGYDQGFRDGLARAPRAYRPLRLRTTASGIRRGYDDGYLDGWQKADLADSEAARAKREAEAPPAPPQAPGATHWACPDCGEPCTCTVPWTRHERCGVAANGLD
jgi:hypothetical protein